MGSGSIAHEAKAEWAIDTEAMRAITYITFSLVVAQPIRTQY